MNSILETAKSYLETEVAPMANVIDSDPEALRRALAGLCCRNLMALRRPMEYGGPALSESEFRAFQEMVARYSGSLAFLQTQHQSAVSMLSKSDNEILKEHILPECADGSRLIGIGFSQLRRHGPPILRAERIDGGYRLDGHAPWVTGYGFYGEFLVGAALEDGRSVFGLVPFVPVDGIKFGNVMRLAAMESPQTVSADFEGYFIADSHVAFLKPPNWIHDNDLINITVQGFFAIGCAMAGLDVVERANDKRRTDWIEGAHRALMAEVESCRQAMVAAQDSSNEDMTTDEKLRVRAWAIDLAVRCAHAGVACSGGAANSVDHDAQRVYREALVYTVSAQTSPIMRATLERLTSTR